MFMNPYTVGPPVRDPQFYSRKKIVDDIRNFDTGNYFLNGLRRIGKTSILMAVEEVLEQQEQYIPLYCSLQGLPNTSDLGKGLSRVITNKLSTLNIGLADRFSQQMNFEGVIEQWVSLCRANHFKSILLLDEAEQLHVLSGGSINHLIRIISASTDVLKVVLAGTRQFFSLGDSRPDLRLFAELFTAQYVGHFNFEESAALIRQTQEKNPVLVTEEDVRNIFEYCGGHPYLLQLVCSDLWDPRDAALKKFSPLSISQNAQIKHFFEQDFRTLNQVQHEILSQLAQHDKLDITELLSEVKASKSTLEDAVTELRGLGVVDKIPESEKYKIGSYLFSNFIKKHTKPKVICRYVQADTPVLEEFKRHIHPLLTQNKFEIIYETAIDAGDGYPSLDRQTINDANILLIFVSPSLIGSGYTDGEEFDFIVKRLGEGKLKTFLILVSECLWQETELAKIQVIPASGLLVYSDKQESSETFNTIADELGYIIRDINAPKLIQSLAADNSRYSINSVFPLNGPPKINFVEPPKFNEIKNAIMHPGRGIVIEGPSGVGKTTLVKEALGALGLKEQKDYVYLSGRSIEHKERIEAMHGEHKGIVIIDDFHRLEEEDKRKISDYIKLLADLETDKRKLIVIGIPNTGKKLISFGHDTATRIQTFEVNKVENDKILSLIEKGEAALNIRFKCKSEIMMASNGSFIVAQYLCHKSVSICGIDKTQLQTEEIETSIEHVIDVVKRDFLIGFEDFIFLFMRIDGIRSRACIKILREAAQTEKGNINLSKLCTDRPEIADAVSRVVKQRIIETFIAENESAKHFLFFDSETQDLIVDDRRLLFFVKHTPDSELSHIARKQDAKARNKVFVCYHLDDHPYYNRLNVQLQPLSAICQIDIWSDERILAGDVRNEKVKEALEETKIAILLISPKFLTSKEIMDIEIPGLLKACEEEGAIVIPVYVKPISTVLHSSFIQFEGLNKPEKTLIEISEGEQLRLFVELSDRIYHVFNA